MWWGGGDPCCQWAFKVIAHCFCAPHGAKRARRMGADLVDAIARAASSREIARSGANVLKILKKLRRSGRLKIQDASATLFLYRRAAKYFHSGAAQMQSNVGAVVSVALGATRVGLKDTWRAAVFLPQQRRGVWCPPQVRSGQKGEKRAATKTCFRVCRTSPISADFRRFSPTFADFRRLSPEAAPRNA